ncbi:TRZ/ATZ family hydrolase [Thioalkalivibrio sp. ALE17]|uniref:TRZ/ATZ family hydrolase n=1 Tax=Thioalkalivibrio sp. ALE17 TaxID=1158173 RepID=UPI00040D949B|nr:TRZ/ATZ family hydrolase [Thioalkalivibrio sp. ALE17]
MNQSHTLILGAPQILPVIPRDTILRDHALIIRDGVIQAIEPTETARARYPDAEYRDHPGHALIPGLVNAHTHSGMSLLRGIGSDHTLMDWLKRYIWPAEGKLLSPEFVRAGTRLSVAEMLRGGTTCFSDMYLFVEDAARVVDETGIRASLGLTVFDFPTPWASTADEHFQRGADVVTAWGRHERIAFNVAPHAPYTVGDASLERVADRARELDAPIHMHVHETASEVADAVRDHGERPLARLARLGMLDQPFIAVHMTQVDESDLDQLRDRPVSVAHCPESNLKLASGFCPVARLQEAGITVGLGTDGTASNNDLDMIGEMRTAALLAKAVSGDAAALPAASALEMATLGSARALGLADRIGSLEPGKQADVVAVDLQALELQPAHDPNAQIVYATTRDAVRDVYVAGRPLLRDRELLTLNVQDLRAEADDWRIRVLETQQPIA